MRAFVSEGTVSKLALEAIGLNIGSVIAAKLFGDREVALHCLASDFEVGDGVMRARTFIIDTDDAVIDVSGYVSLEKETLALAVRPQSKGPRVLALQTPLYIGGSFKDPSFGVDARSIGLQAGAAAALGVLAAPLAALSALIDPGGGKEESPCPALLARAKQAPSAPAPNSKREK